jgi:hypothetical protein
MTMDTPENITGRPYAADLGHITCNIGVADIAVLPDRLRGLQPKVVEALAVSMRQQGLLQPIILRPAESAASSSYYLVAGHHRYEARANLNGKLSRPRFFLQRRRTRLFLSRSTRT